MRISRSTGAFTGFSLILLGIWGGLIPFVGPYFNYSFGSNSTWAYSTNRLMLDIAPGVVVFLGGILLLWAADRLMALLGCGMAMAAGFWFAIGPAFSLLWETGATPIGAPLGDPTQRMLELVGYYYGLGSLIVGLSAFALSRALFRPAIKPEPADQGPISARRGARVMHPDETVMLGDGNSALPEQEPADQPGASRT